MKATPDTRSAAITAFQVVVNLCWDAGLSGLIAKHGYRDADSPAMIRRKAAELRAELDKATVKA